MTPLVTVLMNVYNGANFLPEAIQSILTQTFTAFEFLIINDSSTDASVNIIQSYQDPRITLIHNEHNLGIAKTLNKGLQLAQGSYIAHCDCDDIYLPTRLQAQVALLHANPQLLLCGTNIQYFGHLKHASVRFRKSMLLQERLSYHEHFCYAADYQLWSQVPKHCKMQNLPQKLVKYRTHDKQITMVHRNEQQQFANRVRTRNLQKLPVKIHPTELEIHNAFCNNCFPDLGRLLAWLKKLHRMLPHTAFENSLARLLSPFIQTNPWKLYQFYQIPFNKRLFHQQSWHLVLAQLL